MHPPLSYISLYEHKADKTTTLGINGFINWATSCALSQQGKNLLSMVRKPFNLFVSELRKPRSWDSLDIYTGAKPFFALTLVYLEN